MVIVSTSDGNSIYISQTDFDRLAELYGGHEGATSAVGAAWAGFAEFLNQSTPSGGRANITRMTGPFGQAVTGLLEAPSIAEQSI